jgi:hypothetical protein
VRNALGEFIRSERAKMVLHARLSTHDFGYGFDPEQYPALAKAAAGWADVRKSRLRTWVAPTALDEVTAANFKLNAPEILAVSVDYVAAIPLCEECRRVWLPDDQDRWQAHWIHDSPNERLLFYCRECADREFCDD